MKAFTLVLLTGFTALVLGCTQSTDGNSASSNHKSSRRHHAKDDSQTRGETAHKSRSSRHDEDATTVAEEVEHISLAARERLKREAARRAEELSEYAAEMAEDAKDRAEDLPSIVDQHLESLGFGENAVRRARELQGRTP